jgi:serine/threonine protein phosphatase PrpC
VVSDTTAVPETATSACPTCGEALEPGARFCEACGTAIGDAGDAPDAVAAASAAPLGAAPPGEPGAGACDHCGGTVGADGWCTSCGHRALEAVTVEDRGSLAYATHRGRRHPRNEDAGALAVTAEGWPVLVVADGVSASPNPHLAAAAAVAAVAARLDGRPFGGAADLAAAVALAHDAASVTPPDGDPNWPPDGARPACTLVVAVAAAGAVHVANVGDARVYLLTPAAGGWSARQLSTDDSVAAEAVAAGADPGEALAGPAGHAITAWLGADAPVPEPHLVDHPAGPGDVVLACSDGLWNYAPTDDALATQVAATVAPGGEVAPAAVSERLTTWAVDQGGVDNVCVAIAPYPRDVEETA